MRYLSSRPRAQWSWANLLGIFCIALVLMSGFIQVTHTHTSGQPDHDCALCITAHQVTQGVAAFTLGLSVHLVSSAPACQTIELPNHKFIFKLASRPPPVVSALA
jgi:hypothetical protein